MPSLDSSAPTTKTGLTSRSYSASEISRNLKHFETWSRFQGCDQVAYSDIPDELKFDVAAVFNFTACLPLNWVDDSSELARHISSLSSDLYDFLKASHSECPELFSATMNESPENKELFSDVNAVLLSWKKLRSMRKSRERWTEADLVSNVYSVFRGAAMHRATFKTQCSVSLPQPVSQLTSRLSATAIRVLTPKVVVPDCATFIPTSSLRSLFHSARSPYKTLKNHPSTSKRAGEPEEAAFRYQSTPCAHLPDTACFEVISSIFEDKKPSHDDLEHAYRQNRMATAAAVRHLHSLRIKAPVFGVLWANGTVRAHIDWCSTEKGYPAVLSAPFSSELGDSTSSTISSSHSLFSEWCLERPAEILKVYLLLRNIDRWTMGQLKERVSKGVESLTAAVLHEGAHYSPWKRVGNFTPVVLSTLATSNTLPMRNENLFITPPKKDKDKRGRGRGRPAGRGRGRALP